MDDKKKAIAKAVQETLDAAKHIKKVAASKDFLEKIQKKKAEENKQKPPTAD